MNKILALIVESQKRRVEVLKKQKEALKAIVKKAASPLSFKAAIKREGKISLIGEIKQASPSAGILRKDFSHIDIARRFQNAKVNAISVVTEEEFFLGRLSYIEDIKKETGLAVLRKDFILDEAQILQSRAVGADAVLLIMAILDEGKFEKLYALTKDLGMSALVEVHTEKELKKVLKTGVDIVGINNRNLHTLKVDLSRTQKLIPFIPPHVVRVSESGINSLKDVLLFKGLGVDAVLVGEALMKSQNLEEKIKELHIDA